MNDNNGGNVLTGEELDTMQEIVNIAFGSAARDLAEVIDIFVELTVPEIRVYKTEEVPRKIRDEISDVPKISIVKQDYHGKFKGIALLIFPVSAGRELVALLNNSEEDQSLDVENFDALEKETLVEIGTILIGACVGKVAELLDDVVTYSPPQVIVADNPECVEKDRLYEPDNLAITMKTVFKFEKRDVTGFLFLISKDSIPWIKKAVNLFLERYQ
ncbi:MAG: chemotaxis protein CheC [Deltaproteobacteria bacterium]